MSRSGERRYRFGPFELDPDRYRLLCDGRPVALKPKLFDLLRVLVEARGRLVNKGELMRRLWGDRFVEESNLPQSVYELRRALETAGGEGSVIENVPGRGYLLAEVVEDLPVRPLGEAATADPETHRLFLKCRHFWHQWTPDGWRRSIEYGRRALERDPHHAPAHSWMAASYCTLGISGTLPPREAFGQARELVSRALDLDDGLAHAYEVLAAVELFHEWRWPEVEEALERAVELDPAHGRARELQALLAIVTGRPAEAMDRVRRAVELDPLSLLVNTDAGNVAYYARRYDEALDRLHHTLELDPWFSHARYGLGYVLLQLGRGEEAVAEIEAAVEQSGRDRRTSPDLAYALAVTGERDRAAEILEALLERSVVAFVDPYFPALVHVGLGRDDEAFDWFDRALEARSRELIYLRADPIFDRLHADPRFEELARRIGLRGRE